MAKNLQATEYWSDLDERLITDGNGVLKKSVNVASVLTSIDNILGTTQGERVMLPEFASDLNGFLFDPINPSLQYRLANSVKQVIEKWDDRVEVLGVDYSSNADKSQVTLSVTCRIRGYYETFEYKKQLSTV